MKLSSVLLKSLGKAFWLTLYPPYCLHCDVSMTEPQLFCSHCLSLLEMIDPKKYCCLCLAKREGAGKYNICRNCRQKRSSLHGCSAIFEDMGPARELLQLFDGGKAYLAESLGGYLYLQFNSLGWPDPDLIVPVTGSFSRRIARGYHPSVLLAQEMGKFLQRPVSRLLKRDFYRTETPKFSLRNPKRVADQIVLLVHDRYDSRQIIAASLALSAGAPKKIYAITAVKSGS